MMKIFYRTWLIDRWPIPYVKGQDITSDFAHHYGMSMDWGRVGFSQGAGASYDRWDKASSRRHELMDELLARIDSRLAR